MYLGTKMAGCNMVDAMGKRTETVIIGGDGWGEFVVDGGSVSVWVTREAEEYLYTHLE